MNFSDFSDVALQLKKSFKRASRVIVEAEGREKQR